MSDIKTDPVLKLLPSGKLEVDVSRWVNRVKDDPVTYLQRQAAEITLNTIALTSPLDGGLVLKGGVLMGLAYDSPRQTSDIDLTAVFDVSSKIDESIAPMLDEAFPVIAARLGYTDIVLRTQSIKRMPKQFPFTEASFPALKMKIGYALRGTHEAETLSRGKPISSAFEVDISFNEPLQQTQILSLIGGADLLAYDLSELIAEKLRATLQQIPRKRNRRQDIYDLGLLIAHPAIKTVPLGIVLDSLKTKAMARNIEPEIDAFDNPELKKRSARDWNTMALEVGELPDFEMTYETVRIFYRSLPW